MISIYEGVMTKINIRIFVITFAVLMGILIGYGLQYFSVSHGIRKDAEKFEDVLDNIMLNLNR